MKLPILLAVFGLATAMSAADVPPAQIMGRTQPVENAVRLAFPGTQIQARVTGTKTVGFYAALASAGPCYFNAYLDGIEVPLVTVDDTTCTYYRLAEKLDPARTYDVRLVRRNETWQGMVDWYGFAADDSATWQAAPALPARKLMCLGDSITCGHGNMLFGDYVRDLNFNSNAEATYGWYLAKQFNTQLHLVSYGGKGLVRDWQGLEDQVTLGQLFERSLPDEPKSTWDHTTYQPDAITICIGQNDFNQGIVPAQRYEEAYIELVTRLTTLYPQAKILLLSSPMQDPRQPTELAKKKALEANLAAVVAHFEAMGNHQVRWLSIAHYPGGGYDTHPIAPQNLQMAQEVADVLGPWLGWTE